MLLRPLLAGPNNKTRTIVTGFFFNLKSHVYTSIEAQTRSLEAEVNTMGQLSVVGWLGSLTFKEISVSVQNSLKTFFFSFLGSI